MAREVAEMPAVGRQGFGQTRPGDHIIVIYEDTTELIAFAVPFIREGLANGERCIYVFDDLRSSEVTAALAAGGVEVNQQIERGALILMTAREHHGSPPFSASRTVELIHGRLAEAGDQGFAGLRIAAEITWMLTVGASESAMNELEMLLDTACGPGPLTKACLYRRERFSPAVLQQLIRSHGKVVAGDFVYVSLSTLFRNLARVDLQRFVQSAGTRQVAKGGFFYHHGDPANYVYVLTSGKVKLVRSDPDGRSLILRIVMPTEPFGGRAALEGITQLVSAQALEDSRALVWETAVILQALLQHPAVSLNAIRLMEDRLERERELFQDLATARVERRLARLLLRLADSMGRKTIHGIVLEISLSGQDLGELAGTTPYTVSRILAEWKRLEIVNAGREQIVIPDLSRLAALARSVREDSASVDERSPRT